MSQAEDFRDALMKGLIGEIVECRVVASPMAFANMTQTRAAEPEKWCCMCRSGHMSKDCKWPRMAEPVRRPSLRELFPGLR